MDPSSPTTNNNTLGVAVPSFLQPQSQSQSQFHQGSGSLGGEAVVNVPTVKGVLSGMNSSQNTHSTTTAGTNTPASPNRFVGTIGGSEIPLLGRSNSAGGGGHMDSQNGSVGGDRYDFHVENFLDGLLSDAPVSAAPVSVAPTRASVVSVEALPQPNSMLHNIMGGGGGNANAAYHSNPMGVAVQPTQPHSLPQPGWMSSRTDSERLLGSNATGGNGDGADEIETVLNFLNDDDDDLLLSSSRGRGDESKDRNSFFASLMER